MWLRGVDSNVRNDLTDRQLALVDSELMAMNNNQGSKDNEEEEEDQNVDDIEERKHSFLQGKQIKTDRQTVSPNIYKKLSTIRDLKYQNELYSYIILILIKS